MSEIHMYAAIVGVFFLCLGSFASMLIHRLHFDEPLLKQERSFCPKCKHDLCWKDLIPVLSWVIQGGKCRYCKEPISVVYPIMEISFAALGALFTCAFYGQAQLAPMLIILFGSLCLFWYDARFMEVDRRISIPLILFILFWIFVGPYFGLKREFVWHAYLIGGAVGWIFCALQYFPSKGRWVGFGDLELGLLMGLMLGWKHLLLALFLAYIIGSLIAIPMLILQKAGRKTALPMGAFLIPAMILMLLWGDEIWKLYWNLSTLGI